ncbi:hypothetical protein HDZ31DRAFT_39015 [Schizophyllum fasciatum]
MRLHVLPLLGASFFAHARLWPGRRVATSTQVEQYGPSHAYHVVSDAEISAIGISQTALDGYARRPGCFKDSAARISARCEELDAKDDDRVKGQCILLLRIDEKTNLFAAAIAMTLCELATAKHYSPPLECAPLAADADGVAAETAVGECVGALSRSAQYWSSYSGYLREIPQLCFAYRRWHEIDTARETYRNATLHGLELLRVLDERQAHQARALTLFDAQLQGMQNAVNDLGALAKGMQRLPAIWEGQVEQVRQHCGHAKQLDTDEGHAVPARIGERDGHRTAEARPVHGRVAAAGVRCAAV